MAKKPAAKKSVAKKPPAKQKPPASKGPAKPAARAASPKPPSKKPAARKAAPSKAAPKKAAPPKKAEPKKPVTKTSKAAAPTAPSSKATTAKASPANTTSGKSAAAPKKGAPKPASKAPAPAKPASTPAKTDAKPPRRKSADTKQPDKKSPPPKADDKKPAAKDAPSPEDAAKAAEDAKKAGRKGITIVSDKPMRKPRANPPAAKFPPPGPRLLGPGAPARRPLIVSGPTAPRRAAEEDYSDVKRRKTPLTKKQLDTYRAILLAKRTELIGDVQQMESDALRSSSGSLSNTPQHLAEQGSDSADQSLNLNLAAADRRLIKEIDAALARIADKTYGLCELTGEPINPDRLDELPWARYSIEAARQLESRGGTP